MYRTLICHDGKPAALQPIATAYNGVLFRSRLEARWAVFMVAMSVRYVYEPEAYDLGDCQYLPDFWLPDLHAYLEIKPVAPSTAERRKATLLAARSGWPALILFGQPGYVTEASLPCVWDDGDPFAVSPYNSEWFSGGVSGDWGYVWCQCSVCGCTGLEFEGRGSRLPCGCGGADHHINTPRLRRAYETALSMRFDPASIRRVLT